MSQINIKRRSFLKGLLGAMAIPTALKAGESDVSVLKAKDVPKEPQGFQGPIKVNETLYGFKNAKFDVDSAVDGDDSMVCTTSEVMHVNPIIRSRSYLE